MACRIKFCGLRTQEDVRLAIELGADAIGFVLSESPRRVTPEQARLLREIAVNAASVIRDATSIDPATHAASVNDPAPSTGAAIDATPAIDADSPRVPRVCGVVGPIPVAEVVALYRASGVDVMQVHGNEDAGYWDALTEAGIPFLRAFRMRGRDTLRALRESRLPRVVLDTYKPGVPGGTGETFDWSLAREAGAWTEVILAGGLTPANVREAITAADPWMVDVSGGIESAPGVKEPARMRAFAAAVRGGGAGTTP